MLQQRSIAHQQRAVFLRWHRFTFARGRIRHSRFSLVMQIVQHRVPAEGVCASINSVDISTPI